MIPGKVLHVTQIQIAKAKVENLSLVLLPTHQNLLVRHGAEDIIFSILDGKPSAWDWGGIHNIFRGYNYLTTLID